MDSPIAKETSSTELRAHSHHDKYALTLFGDVNIAQEVLLLMKSLDAQSVAKDKQGKAKKVPQDYKTWSELKDSQLIKIQKIWILLDANVKLSILTRARENSQLLLDAVTAVKAKKVSSQTTKHDKIRLLHLRVHLDA